MTASQTTAAHSFEEHTGEVQVTLRAANLPDLFVEAGRAIAALMLGENAAATPRLSETVRVRAESPAILLVEWLNEIIFQSETKKAVFTEFQVQSLTDHEIVAVMTGVLEPPLRTAVKAATLHGLRLWEQEGTQRATVVLDV